MSFQSVDEIIKHYTKEMDRPMREMDYDLTDEERQERYQRALQRRLALCGSRTYPSVYARDEINALLQGDMDTEADEPHHTVDISDKEETE